MTSWQTHVGNYAPPGKALARGLHMLDLHDSGVPAGREPLRRMGATKGQPAPGQPWEPLRGIPSDRGRALCASVDPSLWFPEPGQSDKAAEAKKLCLICPIQQACKDQSAGERFGIWGAESVNQRTRKRAKKVAPPEMEVAHTVPAPVVRPPKKRKKRRAVVVRPHNVVKLRPKYTVEDVPLLDVQEIPGHSQCPPNVDGCPICYPEEL